MKMETKPLQTALRGESALMSFKVMVLVLGYDDHLIDYGDGCIILILSILSFSLSSPFSIPDNFFSLSLLKC